jgi:hypothetical protein
LADRRGLFLTSGLIAAFLVTRLPWLDADIPLWELTRYSPIDEFGYSVPAANLLDYGGLAHRAAPWAPLEGPPINLAQNVVTAATLLLVGDTFWGLRGSSIVFGLVTFLALIAIVRRQSDEARRLDGVPAGLAGLVVAAATVLLLLDFSLLLSARVVEPTAGRLAVVAAIIALVGRGTLIGDGHGPLRSAIVGAVVGASIFFVYIYNAFLAPACLVAVAWSAWRSGGLPAAARHAVAFGLGLLAATAAFFGLIAVVYGQGPVGWYETWIAAFATSVRGGGFSLAKIAAILEAKVCRLDPAFLLVVLASVPVFAWTLARRPSAWSVLTLAGLAAFVAQAAFVADYPERKFVMLVAFALPIAAAGVLGRAAFGAWVLADHRRIVAITAWLTVAVAITAATTPLAGAGLRGSLLARLVLLAGVTGVAAFVVVLIGRRPWLTRAAALVLAAAIVVPLAVADARYVYRGPSFTYRDAMIAQAPVVDGRTTAGGWSLAMRLYNTSRPVLGVFPSRIAAEEDGAGVVRLFREGGATPLYDFADDATRDRWEALGFRLVDRLPINLPEGRAFGRYAYEAAVAP